MPSGERHAAAPPARRSLARRLAWSFGLTASIAAALAVATALLLADRLVVEHVQRSAMDAATTLAAELDEAPETVDDIEHEARELGIEMRVAVAEHGALRAGDASLLAAPAEPCGREPTTGDLVCRRATTSDPARVVLVAVASDRAFGHRGPFVAAGLGVLAIVLVGAGLAGGVMARRALVPVDRLRHAVAGIDAAAPASVRLPAATDLDEIDALRDAIASLVARLDAELRRTRRFAADAAHELRTPLTKIRAELDLAVEAEPFDPSVLERVRTTARRLERLTERLLVLATPEGALVVDQGTSVSDLAETLSERIDPELATRLRIDTPDDDGLVRGDSVLLAAMLDNLVDNALKYSTGPVVVTVHDEATRGRTTITVDDEGPGVADDRLDELFEPFARDASTRARPGHGLGLPLARHIAHAHGGTVTLARREPKGTRATITLPRAA